MPIFSAKPGCDRRQERQDNCRHYDCANLLIVQTVREISGREEGEGRRKVDVSRLEVNRLDVNRLDVDRLDVDRLEVDRQTYPDSPSPASPPSTLGAGSTDGRRSSGPRGGREDGSIDGAEEKDESPLGGEEGDARETR